MWMATPSQVKSARSGSASIHSMCARFSSFLAQRDTANWPSSPSDTCRYRSSLPRIATRCGAPRSSATASLGQGARMQ